MGCWNIGVPDQLINQFLCHDNSFIVPPLSIDFGYQKKILFFYTQPAIKTCHILILILVEYRVILEVVFTHIMVT